ncbi:hypothetical protein pEaSNUABM20_00295 [Erwinia phage pEa_SNUABM_20]|nr:hypothetical protein pEaSNUABM20_00295 [Erwinia phage pEa_SNUABM_20]
MSDLNELSVAARRLFANGDAHVRDALRAVANTVIADSARFKYEFSEPAVESVYRTLESLTFSGDGTLLLPADEIYAFDQLLNKKYRDNFYSSVCNVAFTQRQTNPRTSMLEAFPRSNEYMCEILARAFVWVLMQTGLDNLLVKDCIVAGHTRLPQFIIALQTEGQDEGYTSLFSLFNPLSDDYQAVSATNFFPEEYRKQLLAEATGNLPPEYREVDNMTFEQLGALLTRLNLVGPASAKKKYRCGCEGDCEDDCDASGSSYNNLEDFDDASDLRDVFYNHYGWPDDDIEIDDSLWVTGKSKMKVNIDIPVVTLAEPKAAKERGYRSKKMPKKAMAKSGTRIELDYTQQLWHPVTLDTEGANRVFAITLVSRHTSGVNRAVATAREAFAIAAVLADLDK